MLYAACDESNNGRFPAFFVAYFSRNEEYVKERGILIPKIKVTQTLKKEFSKISAKPDIWYAYCILTQEIYDYCLSRKIAIYPSIVTNLLKGEDFIGDDLFGRNEFYSDGELSKKLKDDISERCKLLFNINLDVKSGIQLDQKIPLVNFCDTLARYLFRKYTQAKSLERLLKDEHCKQIIF